MREVDVNEVNSLRRFLCEIIKVAVEDAQNYSTFKSDFRQNEVDTDRELANKWINGEIESDLKFCEVCDALGIETDPIFSLLKKPK